MQSCVINCKWSAAELGAPGYTPPRLIRRDKTERLPVTGVRGVEQLPATTK